MPGALPSFEVLAAEGIAARRGFLSVDECRSLLGQIDAYRSAHELPEVYRASSTRPLHYRVIDGEQIEAHLPDVVALYERVHPLVSEAMDEPLVPLEDHRVGLNVNVTPAGGTYRWHYDRNAVTAILYLNAVAGGETEVYPNYRLFLKRARYSGLQRIADRLLERRPVRALFGHLVRVAPEPGLLVAMRGNRCLHSVRPVEGAIDRINIIMAFDRPGATFDVAPQLDRYLYEPEGDAKADPNYGASSASRSGGDPVPN